MTKHSERKKIVEAFSDDSVSLEDFVEKLKDVGFKSKLPPAAVESKPKKKKANL